MTKGGKFVGGADSVLVQTVVLGVEKPMLLEATIE